MSVQCEAAAAPVRSADEWVDVIKADLGRAVEGIVAAGRHLVAAKDVVRHGEWVSMLKRIGISGAEASRLRSIANRLADLPSMEALPTSVSALYELSRLPADTINHGIETGDITPDMTIRDAKDYRASFGSKPKPKPKPSKDSAATDLGYDEARAVTARIREWVNSCPIGIEAANAIINLGVMT